MLSTCQYSWRTRATSLTPSFLDSPFKHFYPLLPLPTTALFTWPSPILKPELSEGFRGQTANLLTSKCMSWQCDWCWPIALNGLAFCQLAVMFWRLEPQSHASWQQQNNILMPPIMANAFRKLVNKIPFSVSFSDSTMLFCCAVSPCSFLFLPPPPHLFLPLYSYSLCYQTGRDRHFWFPPCSRLDALWAALLRYCWQEAESRVKLPCKSPLVLLLPASNNAGSIFHHLRLPALILIPKTCLWLLCFLREV